MIATWAEHYLSSTLFHHLAWHFFFWLRSSHEVFYLFLKLFGLDTLIKGLEKEEMGGGMKTFHSK